MSVIHPVCEVKPPPLGEGKNTVAKRRPSISTLVCVQTFLLMLGSASLVASCSLTLRLKSSLAVPNLPRPHGCGEGRRKTGAASPLRKAVAPQGEHATRGAALRPLQAHCLQAKAGAKRGS